jgi:predicted small lipoprotein YifL
LTLAYTSGMPITRHSLRLAPALFLATAGCGQTGALYLPDAGVETPVEIRTSPTPAPETAPAEDDGEEKKDKPQGR